MKRGDDYLALKENIREHLLGEFFSHAPQAREALDYVEVSTPLSYETFAKRERGGFMGIESSPQRFQQKNGCGHRHPSRGCISPTRT
jgi:all-trans-retinol 13,14-reductase